MPSTCLIFPCEFSRIRMDNQLRVQDVLSDTKETACRRRHKTAFYDLAASKQKVGNCVTKEGSSKIAPGKRGPDGGKKKSICTTFFSQLKSCAAKFKNNPVFEVEWRRWRFVVRSTFQAISEGGGAKSNRRGKKKQTRDWLTTSTRKRFQSHLAEATIARLRLG